ncbi:hypothetical protein TRFO_06799 [Tritrichomonas foetus]|uniref:Uncharacterized protein n=1 Tax=Tritrichomonas foetus TaxID=1144522 RepID=A0A1J4JVV2_9EUKA|nr:hypothetical protein TRFO_06799 [Tritrichomonas foetus]|eukprot:OHT03139.1 hypothetical protein TRFO_06799 [Tritrichomonas foetus]
MYSLGNEKIVLKCLSIRKINYQITASNMKDLYLKLKNNYPSILIYTSINKIIDFCASNIDKKETQEMITKYFTKEEIDAIFRSIEFIISDEDSVFELICNIINERGDNFFTLLSHVQFLNLSIKKRHQYLDFIEPTKLNFDDWKTFITRVKSLFGTCILEDSSIIFRPQYGHEFEGIFNYLNKECSGNCATKKLIHVRCSSLKSTSPEFLFDYKTLSSDKFWSLNNENDGYLQIDFKKRKINLSHYSFHTPNNQYSNILSPKNWEIKGSNDKIHWDILDSRKYDPHLNRHNTFYCYECTYKNRKNYQYIRFYQRGVNHGDDYDTHLSGIEFFGKLIN